MKNKPKLYLLLGLAFLFAGCCFIVYQGQNHWDVLISRGPIGDFLAGTMGPIINIAGIVLVFLSFQEQVKANNIQYKGLQDSLDIQTKTHNFACLDKSLESVILEYDTKYSTKPRFETEGRSFDENVAYFHFHDPLRNFILMCAQLGYFILQSNMLENNKLLLYYRYLVFMRGRPTLYIKTLSQYFLDSPKFVPTNKQHKDIYTIVSNFAVVVTEVQAQNKEILVKSGNKEFMQETLKKYDTNTIKSFLNDEAY